MSYKPVKNETCIEAKLLQPQKRSKKKSTHLKKSTAIKEYKYQVKTVKIKTEINN